MPGWEWSNGWVPKPGIIALRPLKVGDILSANFALLRVHWRAILPFTAVIALVTQVAGLLISASVKQPQNVPSPFTPSQNPNADLRKSLSTLADSYPALGAVELISFIAGILATAVTILILSKAVIGRPAPLAEVWQSVRPRLAQVFGLSAIIALIMGGTIAVFFGPVFAARSAGASDGALAGLSLLMIPGCAIVLWLCVSLLMAAPALILERQGIRSALARSFRLVRGSWWRVLGIMLLVTIMIVIAEGLISVPFTMGAVFSQGLNPDTATSTTYRILAAIGGTIGMTVTLPVVASSIALLYLDQRIRRESLDVSLAAAAGIPGYTHAEG
ncbi:glycerophosphoryl diester phosphodiesterase membrane domain-containing protein [Streptacidiphilus cavernicola]|uniref:Glycerophosphoryl diester phosphodiesterase membrane domain-containing protein n=1 Tax=Streptacidiphilus cavernicola TaxID=3342716 RepID=A0ABV6VZR2_9ACTN